MTQQEAQKAQGPVLAEAVEQRETHYMKMSNFGLKKIALSALITGILFVVVAPIYYAATRVPSSYVKTSGTIVSETSKQVRQPGSANVYYTEYFPTIAFNVNGNTYQFTGNGSLSAPVGNSTTQPVSILYDPSNPGHNPRLAGDNGSIVFSMVLGCVGILLCIIGFALYKKGG